MRQTFTTVIDNDHPENDQSVAATLILVESEEGINIRISKEIAEIQNGGEIQAISEEVLELDSIDVDILSTIRERTNMWVRSESKAAIFEVFEDIEGKYERTDHDQSSTRGLSSHRSRSTQEKTEYSSDKMRFSIAQEGIAIEFPQESGYIGVTIPSAEEVKYQPKDISNADLFNKTLFDFFQLRLPENISSDSSELASPERGAVSHVERIFDRFGAVARQLSERQRDRAPLCINDEYDVQYILQSLLRIYFDDIRVESHTEQHSSVNPRVDFLLETHGIGIEVKLASESMSKKRILTDFAKDKEQYRNFSKIETLLCFVYDPEHIIKNPPELESDLEGVRPNLETHVTVSH